MVHDAHQLKSYTPLSIPLLQLDRVIELHLTFVLLVAVKSLHEARKVKDKVLGSGVKDRFFLELHLLLADLTE